MTTHATLILGKVAGYTSWSPTEELRYIQTPNTTTRPAILQQRWMRHTLDTTGAIMGGEYEWRNVPVVFDESVNR